MATAGRGLFSSINQHLGLSKEEFMVELGGKVEQRECWGK